MGKFSMVSKAKHHGRSNDKDRKRGDSRPAQHIQRHDEAGSPPKSFAVDDATLAVLRRVLMRKLNLPKVVVDDAELAEVGRLTPADAMANLISDSIAD